MDMPKIYKDEINDTICWSPCCIGFNNIIKYRFKGNLMTGIYNWDLNHNHSFKRWYLSGAEYLTKEECFSALTPEQKEHVIYNWNEF